MDWGRAKTILITSFLFLNVLLAYQIWSSRSEQMSALSNSVMIEEVNKLLASKNIRIIGKVPKGTPALEPITVRLSSKSLLNKVQDVSPSIRYMKPIGKGTLKDVAGKLMLEEADSYHWDQVISTDEQYVFNQMYEDIPIFDSRLQLYVHNGEITGYKQMYVEVQSGREEDEVKKEQNVISAYTAVRTLAEKYLSEGAVIQEISLGYHGQQYDSEMQILSPFWRVTLTEGPPYYVQAYSGEVEDTQAAPNNGLKKQKEMP